MSLSFTGFAALGGVAALLAATWGQVKQVLLQVSAVMIVRCSFSDVSNHAVYAHLRGSWKMLPTGAVTYTDKWMRVRGEYANRAVVFRSPSSDSTLIFFKGRKIIFYRYGSAWSIRGFLDFDRLVTDALRDFAETNFMRHFYNFAIITIAGRDKTGMPVRKSDSSDSDEPPSIASSSSAKLPIVLQHDIPMLYSRSEITAAPDKDPLETLYYSDTVLRAIDDACTWAASSDWYNDRGLPWRLGWLLYGLPGTGKSALAEALARKLNFRLYDYKLATLSDQEFMSYWANMSTPCIALFDDFDNVFHGRENVTPHKTLSFDTVLTTLSGVSTRSGVMLIVTTNHIERLDPAMGIAGADRRVSTRPGRLDIALELGALDEKAKSAIATRMLSEWPELLAEALADTTAYTPAQWQEVCRQAACARLTAIRQESLNATEKW